MGRHEEACGQQRGMQTPRGVQTVGGRRQVGTRRRAQTRRTEARGQQKACGRQATRQHTSMEIANFSSKRASGGVTRRVVLPYLGLWQTMNAELKPDIFIRQLVISSEGIGAIEWTR